MNYWLSICRIPYPHFPMCPPNSCTHYAHSTFHISARMNVFFSHILLRSKWKLVGIRGDGDGRRGYRMPATIHNNSCATRRIVLAKNCVCLSSLDTQRMAINTIVANMFSFGACVFFRLLRSDSDSAISLSARGACSDAYSLPKYHRKWRRRKKKREIT